MAKLVVTQVYRLKIVTFAEDQLGINIIHLLCTASTPGGVEEQDAINQLDTVIAPRYKPLLCNSALYRGCGLQAASVPPPTEVFSVANNGVGTGGADQAPTQTCGIITKRSAISSRRTRGRMYVAFPAQQQVSSSGHPTIAYQNALETLCVGLRGTFTVTAGLDSADLTPIVRHLKPPPASSATILTWTGNPRFATQRRRGDYGRTNVLPF